MDSNAKKAESYMIELVPGSDRMYVIFGGIKGGLGVPAFEFYESSRMLGCSRLFFRDHSQSWYASGLPGLGRDVFELADWIGSQLRDINAADVRFVGNSMGGYAAILFGSILRVGRVVAFSPQTTLDVELRSRWGDLRWASEIERVHAVSARKVTDLRDFLTRGGASVPIDIHVSTSEPLDVAHADHLRGIPSVTVTTYKQGGHAVVRHLRDTGRLAEILLG